MAVFASTLADDETQYNSIQTESNSIMVWTMIEVPLPTGRWRHIQQDGVPRRKPQLHFWFYITNHVSTLEYESHVEVQLRKYEVAGKSWS